jgi:hypothetical protein
MTESLDATSLSGQIEFAESAITSCSGIVTISPRSSWALIIPNAPKIVKYQVDRTLGMLVHRVDIIMTGLRSSPSQARSGQ